MTSENASQLLTQWRALDRLMDMSRSTSQRPRGPPRERDLPSPIDDTPENVAKAILSDPPTLSRPGRGGSASHFPYESLWKSHLRRSQLPGTLRDEVGVITKLAGS